MKCAFRVGLRAAILTCAGSAIAQTPPDYGYSWSTIGMPGNRAANQTELRGSGEQGVGVVNYEYRMSRTEVTIGQWLEFVRAYSVFYDGPAYNPEFTGTYIRASSGHPTGPNDWNIVDPRYANEGVTMGWRYAARYCNWLTNGKVMTRDAFESGAYDTSTFHTNADGSFTDQLTRSANALFWIPSREEWNKAMYYDPNRYGSGQDGYWYYPTQGDAQHPPISGYPGEGQTNALILGDDDRVINVGDYADIVSPWGLWDGSGGVSEWTEAVLGDPDHGPIERMLRGSFRFNAGGTITDGINEYIHGRPDGQGPYFVGLRLASIAPSSCCPPDFTRDGFLDFFDYAEYVSCFELSQCPAEADADFNGDGFVDFFDYADFVEAFEHGC